MAQVGSPTRLPLCVHVCMAASIVVVSTLPGMVAGTSVGRVALELALSESDLAVLSWCWSHEVPSCLKVLRLRPERRFCRLGDLSKEAGG